MCQGAPHVADSSQMAAAIEAQARQIRLFKAGEELLTIARELADVYAIDATEIAFMGLVQRARAVVRTVDGR